MTLCSYNIFEPMASTQQKETILRFAARVARVEGKTIIWEDQTRDLVHVVQPGELPGSVVHRERPLEWINDEMPMGIRAILEGWPENADLRALKEADEAKRTCLCCSRLFSSAGPHNRVCDHCRSSKGSAWAAA